MMTKLLFATILALHPAYASAQPARRFDLVTIKPSTSASWTMGMSMQNGTLTLETTVLDRTGLSSRYDFQLNWSPDTPTSATDGPSLYTAIQEQLGLKLNPGKGPVETLVVDHIEYPSEN